MIIEFIKEKMFAEFWFVRSIALACCEPKSTHA